MARQYRTLVLLLPRNDYAGNDLYRPHGVCELPELARSTRPQHLVSLGADAGVPLSLSCQHFGLDDRRIRTSTMVDLRHFSDARWLQQSSEQRQHYFHVGWFRRPLLCAWATLPVPRWPGDRSWSRRRSRDRHKAAA